MSFINLSDYIIQWGFLRNLSHTGKFDCIIYEQFTKEWFDIPKWITLHTFQELWIERWISGTLSTIQSEYKRILLILDQVHRSELIPYLENYSPNDWESLHGIALHSGISWMLNGIWKRNTLWWISIHTWAIVHDPFDVPSFFSWLEQPWVHLHMIHDWDYLSNLYMWNEEARSDETLHSLTWFWFSGHNGTLLCTGRVVSEVVWAVQVLQEQERFYDVFVSELSTPKITDELRESLIKTERLIIISDQSSQVIYTMITTLLDVAWLSEVAIEFVTPQTEWVTTTQWEYLYEQAKFSKEGLVERLRGS